MSGRIGLGAARSSYFKYGDALAFGDVMIDRNGDQGPDGIYEVIRDLDPRLRRMPQTADLYTSTPLKRGSDGKLEFYVV